MQALFLILILEVSYDNAPMTSTLGIVPYPLNDTILDTSYWMIEQGHSKRTEGFKSRIHSAQPK